MDLSFKEDRRIMTIEKCLERCETKDFDGTMVSISELKRAVEYIDRLRNVREKIVKMVIDLENTTRNRHMNDLEYGRYTALNDALELLDDTQ